MSQRYAEPVSRLITLGEEPARQRPWPDYPAELGLDSSHVPELIRMVVDPELRFAASDSTEVFANIHAWRALGQLRAEAAIEPLLTLLDEADEFDDEWALEEIPRALALIGLPAMDPIAERLFDPSRSLYTRVAASETLRRMAVQHEAARGRAVEALATQLALYEQNDPTLNGFIVTSLAELQAVGKAPLIESALSADAVDINIMGDWEDVQIELGLLDERTTPRPRFEYFVPHALPEHAPPEAALAGHQSHAASSRRKARRKAAKDSRRKNRRKKK
jgi:hypothetical protein